MRPAPDAGGAVSVDTPRWVRDAVFYQIFPDRFASSDRVRKPGALEAWDAPPTFHGFKGGDLLGIVEHLDHLVDLGVTALYLTPIFTSASNHRYHTDDYLSVDPLLGGDAALRELLDTAHARGLRVVLDGVFNHTGRGFWPFHHIVEAGAQSPYRDWFYVDRERLERGGRLRPYPDEGELAALDADASAEAHRSGAVSLERLGYRAWWDLPALPKLNVDDPDVREYVMGVAEHWLRFGIDGWRLDVPTEIEDRTFWQEFRERCRAIRPDAYLVGEIWRERPDWVEGDRFDALMNYPLTEAIVGFAGGAHVDWEVVAQQHEYRDAVRPLDGPAFAERIEQLLRNYDPAVVASQLNLLSSHDAPRFLTVCSGDVASLRLATLLQMTLPGAPSIYYGDEVGLEGRHDPDCRRAFPWDEARWDRDVLDPTRAMALLRHRHPALRSDGYRTAGASGCALAYVRGDVSDDRLVVALNAGETEARLEVALPDAEGASLVAEPLPGWRSVERTATSTVRDGRATLEIAAREGLVARLVHKRDA